MKRIISLFVLLMAATLCGCDSNRSDDESGRTEMPEETAVSDFAGATGCSQFANDSAVYIDAGKGEIQQWSFDGTFQKQFRVMKKSDQFEFSDIISVENDRIFYTRTNWTTYQDEIMQVPIKENEEGQYLDVDHQKKLWGVDISDIGYGGLFETSFFYINEDYIVCLKDQYSEGGMLVYNLREEKEVKIKNLPKQIKKDAEGSLDTIYQFTDSMASVQSQVCGNQIIFNTEPVGDNRYGAPYGFSVYRLGEDHVETIDERCYTAAAYITDEKRQKVYYQIETDQSIWEYDCESGEKRELISEQEFQDCYKGAGLTWQEDEDDDSMFLQGDTLYIIRAKGDIEDAEIVSYDLQGGQGLRYEQKVTQELKRWGQIAEGNEGYVPDGTLAIVLGKLILYFEDEEVCFCIDLATAEGKQVVRGDKECIYYMMAAGVEADVSGYYETDEAKWSKEKTAEDEKQQKRKEKEDARRKEFRENEKRAAKLSEKEQLTQLAGKMIQQYKKWDRSGKEEWLEGVCYAVTDLDHNGVPELILSTGPQGSGGFTITAMYGVGAEGQAVTLQKPSTGDDIVEFTGDGDVVNPIDTAYYDADEDIWYYVTQDYTSTGYRGKGHTDDAWKVKTGEWEREDICGYFDDIDHKSKQYKTTYFKVVGEDVQEIAKSEYNVGKIMDEHFADCVKYRVAISWGQMKRKKMLSAEPSEIFQKLQDSYHAFETTELP